MKRYHIKIEEVSWGEKCVSAKELDIMRNALSDLVSEKGIQLAWANAMLDAGITKQEINSYDS